MRKVREVLRLKWANGFSERNIARSCDMARSTVAEYLRRARAAGLAWPLPEGLDDASLERRLFPATCGLPAEQRPVPVWPDIHREMKRKGVTLFVLWQEYKESYPEGFQYSQFCHRYRLWQGKLDIVMRHEHRAGEKLFVDYAGQTVPIIDRTTGEIHQAQIFVAVLGASNYTYVEATWTQRLPDWCASHMRAFKFIDGCPEILVPDNLKSGVTKAHRYDPELNKTYQDLSVHYGVAIVPARSRKPRDKAKVEQGVLLAERWVLARLRNHQFFSLAELNAQIRTLLEELNHRAFKKLAGSRRSHYEDIDRPALKALPAEPYLYAEWSKVRVAPNIHVQVEHHYYSVPHALFKRQLDARLSANTVELFHRGARVASHRRSFHKGGYTTVRTHMPMSHQQYLDWTPQRFVRWANHTGLATASVIEEILASRPFPQQGYKACYGVMRLGKSFGDERLEAACARALALGTASYRSIESILKKGLDRQPLAQPTTATTQPVHHENVRGPDYYH
jgi:transposase